MKKISYLCGILKNNGAELHLFHLWTVLHVLSHDGMALSAQKRQPSCRICGGTHGYNRNRMRQGPLFPLRAGLQNPPSLDCNDRSRYGCGSPLCLRSQRALPPRKRNAENCLLANCAICSPPRALYHNFPQSLLYN